MLNFIPCKLFVGVVNFLEQRLEPESDVGAREPDGAAGDVERFSRQLFTIFSRKFVLSTSTPMCGICVMYFYTVNQVAGQHPRCVKSIELGRCCHFMVVSCCVLLPRVVSCLRAVHPAASVSLWRRMNQRRNCCPSLPTRHSGAPNSGPCAPCSV